MHSHRHFNPQGPRRPRRRSGGLRIYPCGISIPRALAGPDYYFVRFRCRFRVFQSPGPSQAPTRDSLKLLPFSVFQSPGPSQAPTYHVIGNNTTTQFQSPGPSQAPTAAQTSVNCWPLYFNPQGPRRPRRESLINIDMMIIISIPRALAGPDSNLPQFSSSHPYFFQQNVNFPSTVPSLLPLSPKQNPHFLPNPQCECPGDFMIASHSH